MKNKVTILLLVIWVLGGVIAGNFFSNKAATSEGETVVSVSQNNPQFSTSTSYDDLNVYATSTLSESSPSGLSYRITITITSPSGRSNTKQSDWSPAPITHTSGLSIGNEDGTYNVQATFESQGGSYDDYDNFDGSGSIYLVGTTTSDIFLRPRIGVRAIRIIPAVSPNNTVNTVNATIEGDISFDVGVNVPNVRVHLNRLDTNEVSYNVGIPFGTDNTVTPVSGVNRAAIVTSNPGGARRVSFPITFGPTSQNGTVIESIRIDPDQYPSPNPVTVNPEEQQVTFNFVRPSPSPSPSTSPTPDPPGECRIACEIFDPLCCYLIPIVVDISGNGFDLTNAADGVMFDFNGDGTPHRMSWTAANSDDAWLVLDRNNNQRIDNGEELFGNATPQPTPPANMERHGFLALAEYDKAANGGNADGKITRRDAVFRKLRLWQDRNHNGISEAEELSRLPALDVVAIFLNYHESRRTDRHGNRFKYRARVRDRRGADVGRWAWDVFLLSAP